MRNTKKSLPTYCPTCYINGSKCNKKNCIGYCHNAIHRGYLSLALMKQHKCIERECKYFKKIKNSYYWMHKEKAKKKFNENKQRKKDEIKKANTILNRFKELTANINSFCVTDIQKKDGVYILKCAALRFADISAQISTVRREMNEKVNVVFIKANQEKKKAIIEKYKNESQNNKFNNENYVKITA